MKRTRASTAIVTVYYVAIAEIISRVIVAAGWLDPYEFYGYPSDLFVQHETRGYGYRPDFRGDLPNGRFRSIPIEINSAGFRDDEYSERKERVRIVALGDSITFGAGVNAFERWTDKVEDLLCKTGSREVLSLGVNGYQADNYLEVARGQFESLEPDLVVIGFCMTDIRSKQRLITSLWMRVTRRRRCCRIRSRCASAYGLCGRSATIPRRVSHRLGPSGRSGLG